MKTFKFYSDPGHGWLAVKRQLLIDLNIADKITYFSYQRGKTVYLEEDCDCHTFYNALKQNQIEFTVDEQFTNNQSPIRSYGRFCLTNMV